MSRFERERRVQEEARCADKSKLSRSISNLLPAGSPQLAFFFSFSEDRDQHGSSISSQNPQRTQIGMGVRTDHAHVAGLAKIGQFARRRIRQHNHWQTQEKRI